MAELKGVERLMHDYKNLWLDGQSSSDALLKFDDREFRVHKAILSARSPVFASMFQQDMKEETSGLVDIPECSAASFEIFLKYIYSANTDDLATDNIFGLYCAADKYQIDDLRGECVKYMKRTLSVDNFCDVIDVCVQHGESELKQAAACFFHNNIKRLITTVQLLNYFKESPMNGVEKLVHDYMNLWLDGQNSDTLLKFDDQEFRVHKAILSARSPVFASMYQQDLKEKTSGVIDVPDCSAETFKIFLQYIYSASTDGLTTDNMFDLYYTADKYQIDDLKEECVKYMKMTLSVDNFCDVIAFSLQYSESELEEAATCFFCANTKRITSTVQWLDYFKENPVHGNKLFIKASV